MTIEVECKCGKRLKAKPRLAGKRVRCPVCKHPLRIPDVSDASLAVENARVEPPNENDDLWKDFPERLSATSPTAADSEMAKVQKTAADQLLDEARAERAERKKDLDSWATKQVISGISMTLAATVWFGVGLLGGRLYFYPPILFVLGAVALINGISQKLHREA